MLQIYNSLTRGKVPFTPRVGNRVGMYVCGMTVYDFCHIGHARVLVVFDIVARYLRYLGYDLHYVRNITDIDDKIIQRANENGESITALTDRFIAEMNADAAALGVLPPDEEPRATAHIDEIITMIKTLVDNGHAYAVAGGDVYYDVSRFEPYGKLSGKKLEDLRAGERVRVDTAKDDPLDFVLWKRAKPDEPSWESPWGQGRPGWHIECSAMSTCCLGNSFDIHGGGMDLMFPHHENEIAQSEAATGQPFAATWMHNGFVNIDNEKMSKSLGNFFTIREVLKKYHPEVVRYFILTSHYRSPLNYSDKSLDNAKSELDGFYAALRGVVQAETVDAGEFETRLKTAMDDDFNTALSLAVLRDVRHALNKAKNTDKAAYFAAVLTLLGAVLGLFQQDPEEYFQGINNTQSADNKNIDATPGSNAAIDALVARRDTARLNKDWNEADRIRNELDTLGIVLEDAAGKSSWRRK